jgi:GNAT superfamily N-acetyltransferase
MARVKVEVRRGLQPEERGPIEALLRATGFFNREELTVAMELVDEALLDGGGSHYRFVVASQGSEVTGYACWGPIPGTVASADLYWIAVHPDGQGRGVGKALLDACERWIDEEGRNRVYIETSTRPQYLPTRAFYLRCGYSLAAELENFYAPGDGKAIFVRVLASSEEAGA